MRPGGWKPYHGVTTVTASSSPARVSASTSSRLPPRRRDDVAADLNPLAPALYHADRDVAPSAHRATRTTSRSSADVGATSTTSPLIVPLTDLDQQRARRTPRRAPGARASARAGRRRANDRQVPGAPASSRSTGSTRRRTWLPGRACRRISRFPSSSSRAGASARATSTAPRSPGARLLPRATRRSSRWCSGCCERRGVLDRRLLRPRRALPQRDPAHDDRVERRRVDQGNVDSRTAQLIELGRSRSPRRCGIVGPATVQCFRTDGGRHEVTDVNVRFGGAFPVPHRRRAAATPSSPSRSRAASGPSRGSASSATASS